MSPNGEAFQWNPNAPETGPRYPQARSVPSSTRTIYVSGIASVGPDGKVSGAEEKPDGTIDLDVRKQTAAVLSHIDGIIQGASNGKGNIANLIDAVVYVVNMERDYAGMNEEWNKIFTSRAVAPARATVGVASLPDPRFLVEVKGVAVVPD